MNSPTHEYFKSLSLFIEIKERSMYLSQLGARKIMALKPLLEMNLIETTEQNVLVLTEKGERILDAVIFRFKEISE